MIYKVMVSNLMVSWFAKLDDGIFCWSHRFSHPPWIGEAVKHVGCEDQNFYKKGIASDSTQSDGSGHAAGQASQAIDWASSPPYQGEYCAAMVGIDDMNPIIKALLSTSQEVSFFGKIIKHIHLCARIKEGFLGNCYLPLSSAGLFCA